MKRILISILFITSLFSIESAVRIPITINLFQTHEKFEYPDLSDTEDRTPAAGIKCTISGNEVSVEGIDPTEILSFEICSEDGKPIAVYTDQREFAQHVLSLTEPCEIVICCSEFDLVGKI